MRFGHFLAFGFALVFPFGGTDCMREPGKVGVVLWAGGGGRGSASATAVLVWSRADSECLRRYTGAAGEGRGRVGRVICGKWDAAGSGIVLEPSVAKATCFLGTMKSSLGFIDGVLRIREVALN